jgi:nitrite reductase/ring-hydroxylating ferredoxin subunit
MTISATLATVDVGSLRRDRDTLMFAYTDPFGLECQGFIFLLKGSLYAYRNLCPHWGVAMDHEGSCFERVGARLMCHVHGARFDPTTGHGVSGPGQHLSLERFIVEPVPNTTLVHIIRRPKLFG